MKLITTYEYSLSELFSTPNRKIIIPDFQRDYCWGDKSHGDQKIEIVSAFLDTLIEEHTKGETTLGKIDVYENPKDHIYLTDGQQRLTTLYLIIGMLCKKVRNEELNIKIKQCLISQQEESHDDKEPYLQYSIRESSLFFLRDLVNDFFITNKEMAVEAIGKQPWYFNDYDLDPTIQSMVNALKIIEKKLVESESLKLEEFSDFIINNVKIQYYDVQNRKHGEERFVIINTTGKNLSISENIKPILLGNIEDEIYSKQWEKRENFFWKYRRKNIENIADEGVNDFLKWCFQIIKKQENIDLIRESKQFIRDKNNTKVLLALDNYFNAVNNLIGLLDSNPEMQKQFAFINESIKVEGILGLRNLNKDKDRLQNILLPLLAFMVKFQPDETTVYKFIRRLRKNYFDKIWRERNANYLNWRYILQIIEKSAIENDCFNFESFEKIGNIELPIDIWYNTEEKLKSQLSIDSQQLIEMWEDHEDFMGDITPLFNITKNTNNIDVLNSYFETYNNIRIKNYSYSPDNINLKNIYRLYSCLLNGIYEHRVVNDWGYCMLNESENKDFLLNDFDDFWLLFHNNSEQEISDVITEKLLDYFTVKILQTKNLEDVLNDVTILNHHSRIKFWAIMEYLYCGKRKPIDFSKSIACFWAKPNVLFAENPNDFTIENFLLGYSYYNNKTGNFIYDDYLYMRNLKASTIKNFNMREELVNFVI